MNNYKKPLILGMINPNKMNLKELKTKLNHKDERTVKNWLKQKSIPLKREGREYTVFEWEIDLVIQSELVDSLKKRYPATWYDIYKAGATDENMMKAVFVIHPPISKTRKFK